MMTDNQAQGWLRTSDSFRQAVQERLDEGVTDTGELEMLARVCGIACDVSSAITQLGLKEIELQLEKYRIELGSGVEDEDEDTEVELEPGVDQTLAGDNDEQAQG